MSKKSFKFVEFVMYLIFVVGVLLNLPRQSVSAEIIVYETLTEEILKVTPELTLEKIPTEKPRLYWEMRSKELVIVASAHFLVQGGHENEDTARIVGSFSDVMDNFPKGAVIISLICWNWSDDTISLAFLDSQTIGVVRDLCIDKDAFRMYYRYPPAAMPKDPIL